MNITTLVVILWAGCVAHGKMLEERASSDKSLRGGSGSSEPGTAEQKAFNEDGVLGELIGETMMEGVDTQYDGDLKEATAGGMQLESDDYKVIAEDGDGRNLASPTPNYIEIGNVIGSKWRLADIDGLHFSVSSDTEYTPGIYRYDGTAHSNNDNPRQDFNGWTQSSTNTGTGPLFGHEVVQIGDWRIKHFDTLPHHHLSISHASGNVARIFRSDGTDGNDPDFSGWSNPDLGAASCAYLTKQYLQIGPWRIGTDDNGVHLLVSHRQGWTAQIFRHDGRLFPGSRTDYNAWNLPDGELLQGSKENCLYDNYLQIGHKWRLAEIDGNHLSVSSAIRGEYPAMTSQIYRYDGTSHANNASPRRDFNAWTQQSAKSVDGPIFGHEAVQMGQWRISQINTDHLSISHSSKNVARIFRSDGTMHGNVPSWNGFNNPDLGEESCAYLSEKYLQIGAWRLGVDDSQMHLSVTHMSGSTAQVFRDDGIVSPGPRVDFNSWNLPDGPVLLGSAKNCPVQNELKIGSKFKIAVVGDANHLSISSPRATEQIFRSDGKLFPKEKTGFNAWSQVPIVSYGGVIFGNKAVQIGEWRIRQINVGHLSISHKSGNVARIFRSDGEIFGNVGAFNGWNTELGKPKCAYLSEKYLQVGVWRIGTPHEDHLSVSRKDGRTCRIYREDGQLFPGPRTDFDPWSIPDGTVLQGSAEHCPPPSVRDDYDFITGDLIYTVDDAEDHTTEVEKNVRSIDMILDDINEHLKLSKEINNNLHSIDDGLNAAITILDRNPAIQFIPKIGQVVSAMKSTMRVFRPIVAAAKTASNRIEPHVSFVRNQIANIDKKVETCDAKILYLINKEIDFMTALYQTEKCMETIESSSQLEIIKSVMKNAADTFKPFVTEFDSYQVGLLDETNDACNFLDQCSVSINKLASLQNNIDSAFDTINQILSPIREIRDLLNYRITLPVPLPSVEWCCIEVWGVCVSKYPCDVTVSEFSFTIEDIIGGHIPDFLKDIFRDAMNAILDPFFNEIFDAVIDEFPIIDMGIFDEIETTLSGFVNDATSKLDNLVAGLDHPDISTFKNEIEQFVQTVKQIQSSSDICEIVEI